MSETPETSGHPLDALPSNDGTLDEVKTESGKRIVAIELSNYMKEHNISASEMARKLKTSRNGVRRILDAELTSISLATIERVATVIGKRARFVFEPIKRETPHVILDYGILESEQATAKETLQAANLKLPADEQKAYESHGGAYFVGDSQKLLSSKSLAGLKGRVQLLLTSPPYPLNEKKSYGNLTGKSYLRWIESLAPIFANLLTNDGSIVMELGNSWEPGRPVQSLLALEALLAFTKAEGADLRLIQQFVCYNPSRLPSPASWVTVNPLRTVDSFTHVWWLAKTDYPKADNRKVLRPYSNAMKSLLKRGTYNAGGRPSEHRISEKGFLKDRGGSITHNLFELEPMDVSREVRLPNAFSLSNTASQDFFHRACQKHGIVPHPARMPVGLASFFIEYLTDKEELVRDPFGGSNTTGYAAALAERRWITIEAQEDYVEQSKLRFLDPKLPKWKVSK